MAEIKTVKLKQIGNELEGIVHILIHA